MESQKRVCLKLNVISLHCPIFCLDMPFARNATSRIIGFYKRSNNIQKYNCFYALSLMRISSHTSVLLELSYLPNLDEGFYSNISDLMISKSKFRAILLLKQLKPLSLLFTFPFLIRTPPTLPAVKCVWQWMAVESTGRSLLSNEVSWIGSMDVKFIHSSFKMSGSLVCSLEWMEGDHCIYDWT